MPTWDPDVLARIAQLELRARMLIRGFLHGGHASTRTAANVEFADYKPYAPGDPLRDLDWRVLGRTDRLVVRRHRGEDELAVTLVVDASGDLATGSAGQYGRPPLEGSKWGTAAVLAATIAEWAGSRGDPVGLAVLGGEGVRWRWLPPRGGASHRARIFGVLAETRPAGRADLAAGLLEVGRRVRRRSVVVLLSDLMEPPESWGPAVDAFGERRTDLRVVHLHDPSEWAFDMGSPARFYSPEGGMVLGADPADVAEQMAVVVDEYLAEVRGWLARSRGHHVLAPTGQPLAPVVGALLGRGL